MNFETLLAIAIALYVLLNFVAVPRLAQAFHADRRLTKIGKAGLLSALEFIRDLAFIASAVYLTFALLTLALGFAFGRNATVLSLIVSWADRTHGALKVVKTVVESYFFLIPTALIVFVCWRRRLMDFTGRFERLVDDEYDRLNLERERGAQWDDLEPDDRMQSLSQEMASLQEALGRLAPGERGQRQALRRRLVKLSEERSEADYQRRVCLDALGADPRSGHTSPGWMRFVLSKGFFDDMKGATRLLSRATLAVLTLALVGAASKAGLATELSVRVLALDDLRVEATKAVVAQEWKELSPSGRDQSLTDEDRRAMAHLADSFARALVQNRNWMRLGKSAHPSAQLQQRLTRRAILDHVRLPNPDGGAAPGFADDLPAAHREILNAVAGAPEPESRLGRIVAEREGPGTKAFFGSKWEGVKASVLSHASAYQEPLRMKDLEASLMDRIVSAAFDGVVPQAPDSEIIRQARGAMSAATKKAVNEAVITEFHRVVVDLAEGASYPERIARLKTDDIAVPKARTEELAALIHDRHWPDTADFERRTATNSGAWRSPEGPAGPEFRAGANGEDQPPRGGGSGNGGAGGGATSDRAPRKAYDPTGAENNPVIRDMAARATRDGQYSLREESLEALAQYEDHFPRSLASQSRTPLARTLEHFRLPADAAQFTRFAELKVARAGSFSMLRGFSRVGGVLIGEDPDNPSETADVRTLSWRIAGRSVTLALGNADGRVQQFGPYDQSLVHQALAYAADGRPVAVTMTEARPLPQLKIHLNPSLVDTPLGCRVTQLDRLVDTYAGVQLPQREAITERYMEQLAVYDLVWGLRLGVLAGIVGKEAEGLKAEAMATIESNQGAARRGLVQTSLFDDSSVFRRKPEYFDPGIVQVAVSCRNAGSTAFETCVSKTFASAQAFKKRDGRILRRWLEGYATFVPWSGVRERKFHTTSDLAFLREPNGESVNDRLWPFDFIVQLAFTSPAVNLPQSEQDKYADTRPIEFVEIQPKIADLVAAGIDRDGFRDALADLRAFTMLQRLFRLALRGNMGDAFPLEQLGRLTAATAGAIPYFHTARWNGSWTAQFQSRLIRAMVSDQPEQWMRAAKEQANRCRHAMLRASESGTLTDNSCDFSSFSSQAERACHSGGKAPGCLWKDVAKASANAAKIVELESAFGVLADQRESAGDPGCPPLAPAPVRVSKGEVTHE